MQVLVQKIFGASNVKGRPVFRVFRGKKKGHVPGKKATIKASKQVCCGAAKRYVKGCLLYEIVSSVTASEDIFASKSPSSESNPSTNVSVSANIYEGSR